MARQPSGVYVRAKSPSGKWGAFDALDLTDESFRRFVLRNLVDAGCVVALMDEHEAVVPLDSTNEET